MSLINKEREICTSAVGTQSWSQYMYWTNDTDLFHEEDAF